jgi:hypothetical protein
VRESENKNILHIDQEAVAPCVRTLSWHECHEQVVSYLGALHRKYMSYEEAIRDFNSTINSNNVSTAASSFITKTTHAPRPSVPLKFLAIIVFSILVCVLYGRGLISNCGARDCNLY